MKSVFLDTVGLLASWDTRDQWHLAVEQALLKLSKVRPDTITTTFVLLECGNAAARTPYRPVVDRLRGRLEARGWLVSPTHEDWESAWAAYGRDEAGGAGIVDHVSFEVMRRLGISHALTNDQHFRTAGFEILF